MILNSDIILTHPLWERADQELCNRESIGLFKRLVDIFILACSIGIKEDQTITEFENHLEQSKSIGRTTYQSLQNENLKALLDFMLQNAIINTKTLDIDVDERLRLAFDPDYNIPKLSPTGFLVGFANYGITKIFEHVDSRASLVVVNEMYDFLHSLEENQYDDLIASISLDKTE